MRARLKELIALRDKTNAELEPLRQQCNKVHVEMQKLYDTIAPLGEKIKAAMPEQQRIENEIAKLAMALGGRRMSDTNAAPG